MIDHIPELYALVLSGDIGDPPPEKLEGLYKTLLGANHLFGGTAGATISLDADNGRIALCRALPLALLDCDKFFADVEGIFSHCPVAYDPKNPYTKVQIARFRKLVADAAGRGIRFKKMHIAASDAINNFPESMKPPFNVVRTGINLHGSFDPNGTHAYDIICSLGGRVERVAVRG